MSIFSSTYVILVEVMFLCKEMIPNLHEYSKKSVGKNALCNPVPINVPHKMIAERQSV